MECTIESFETVVESLAARFRQASAVTGERIRKCLKIFKGKGCPKIKNFYKLAGHIHCSRKRVACRANISEPLACKSWGSTLEEPSVQVKTLSFETYLSTVTFPVSITPCPLRQPAFSI